MAGKFQIKKAENDKVFFNLLAANGQVVLTSQMYENKANAMVGVESVKTNGGDESSYELLVAKDGSPYFVLKAANGQVIGNSQMYASEDTRKVGIQSCMSNAPVAAVDDQTAA